MRRRTLPRKVAAQAERIDNEIYTLSIFNLFMFTSPFLSHKFPCHLLHVARRRILTLHCLVHTSSFRVRCFKQDIPKQYHFPSIYKAYDKSRRLVLFKGTRCVIGAVLSINEKQYIAAASHIFHKKDTESHMQVNGEEGIVRKFLEDFDVALIELSSNCAQKSPLLAVLPSWKMPCSSMSGKHPLPGLFAPAYRFFPCFSPAPTCCSPGTAAHLSSRKKK